MLLKKPRKFLIPVISIATITFGLSFLIENSALADELGYLGPIGTYSEQATKVYQSQTPGFDKIIPYKTITAVTTAIKNGEVKRGLIPIENSNSGFVAETYRIILEKPDPEWRIIDEVTIPITSSLLVKPGTKTSDIKKIISHPNALRGVATYLNQNFSQIPLVEVNSTAAAAKLVSNGDGTTAAVASPNAAQVYKLKTIATNIQDKNYETNFWVILQSVSTSFNPNSNHLIISLKAPYGSPILSDTITKLKDAGFNVLNVNSVPLGGSLHSYRYLIRFESKSQTLKQVTKLLETMQKSNRDLLLIGAYQR